MEEITRRLQRISVQEKQLKRVRLDTSSRFKINVNGSIYFNLEGAKYKCEMNRAIVHQLGNRLWPELTNGYDEIKKRWDDECSWDSDSLSLEIENSLRTSNSTILLNSNNHSIYGIISDQFAEIDPLEFRSQFVNLFKKIGSPTAFEKGDRTYTPYGEPIEYFTFESHNYFDGQEQIEYSVGLIYGLNNGYSSFRFLIGREILVCSNGLTKIAYSTFAQLKHTKNADITAFVKKLVADVIQYNKIFQELIFKAKNRIVTPKQFEDLFNRLHVSAIVKNRIKERFEFDKNTSGMNEWALSQSFTNVATHFYKPNRDKHHERVLTEVGSDILDHSLDHVLNSVVRGGLYGNYTTFGNILPSDYSKAAVKIDVL